MFYEHSTLATYPSLPSLTLSHFPMQNELGIVIWVPLGLLAVPNICARLMSFNLHLAEERENRGRASTQRLDCQRVPTI